MRTRAEKANIAYCSPLFMRSRLDAACKAGLLSWYGFIFHYAEGSPEDDEREADKKDHIHFFIVPQKTIELNELIPLLTEVDPENPDKKASCTHDWRSMNSFTDWYLYTKHDEDYLKWKGLKRKYHYKHEDFVTNDQDAFNRRVSEIKYEELFGFEKVIAAASSGMSYSKFLASHMISGTNAARYTGVYQALLNDFYREQQRKDHEEYLEKVESFERTNENLRAENEKLRNILKERGIIC